MCCHTVGNLVVADSASACISSSSLLDNHQSSYLSCRRRETISVRNGMCCVAGYNYEGEQLDQKEFSDSIDQLALAFSSR
jgi:hypothetical protein